MKKYKVKKGKAVILNIHEEIEVTEYISEITISDNLKIIAYNICREHIHLILICLEKDRDNIVQKLKAVTSRKFLSKYKNTQEQGVMTPCSQNSPNHLWAQKYNLSYILDEDALQNKFNYVKYNRQKHGLPENKRLQDIIDNMLTPYENIF